MQPLSCGKIIDSIFPFESALNLSINSFLACVGVRESSGEGVVPVAQAGMEAFRKMFREEMRCERRGVYGV
jgi:hypothetical protein